MRAGRIFASSSMDQDSFDSYTAEEMLVMATDAMHINQNDNEDAEDNLELAEDEELPKSLIVTNVDLSVFDDESIKSEFEVMVQEHECPIAIHYLRSFRRVRVDFSSNVAASKVKEKIDMTLVGDNLINCYFIQVISPCNSEDTYLAPPPVEKAFLISPPCSPPVGWEQPREACPVPLDYDLLAAMAQLNPGENHELHPSKEVTIQGHRLNTPSIVVHVCEEHGKPQPRPTIVQTRCPERKGSLDD